MPLVRSEPEKTTGHAEPDFGLDGLNDASPEVRFRAARAAPGQPDSIPLLARALERETDSQVLEAIFTALARVASPRSVLTVLPYVRSDSARLRTGALDALRAMPDLTRLHLRELLSDPDSDVRLLVCDLARVMTDCDTPQLLCALIEGEPNANVCAAAVEALAEIGDARAVPTLRACARRFPGDPFLQFAIKSASERLSAHADGG